MLLSAHQPVYLPWLGLFHKVAVSERFVIFDDVPYSKKMWYNRNRILGPNGVVMLSVPVLFSGNDPAKHKDVRIDNSQGWARKHWKSLESAYRKTRYFADYAGDLEAVYAQTWTHLSALNEALLRKMMQWLQIDTPLVHASDYAFHGEKSDLVMDMCIQMKADAYLFGALGREYANIEAFKASGVAPLFQDYNHPVYQQDYGAAFEPNMCALDLLFRHGPESGGMLRAGNMTREDYIAEARCLLA